MSLFDKVDKFESLAQKPVSKRSGSTVIKGTAPKAKTQIKDITAENLLLMSAKFEKLAQPYAGGIGVDPGVSYPGDVSTAPAKKPRRYIPAALQAALNRLVGTNLKPDNDWGTLTDAAVAKFKDKFKVNPQTDAELFQAIKQKDPGAGGYLKDVQPNTFHPYDLTPPAGKPKNIYNLDNQTPVESPYSSSNFFPKK